MQKAKVKWGIEADENTKFFHGVINKKRSQLAISGIKEEGEWVTKTKRIKQKKSVLLRKIPEA